MKRVFQMTWPRVIVFTIIVLVLWVRGCTSFGATLPSLPAVDTNTTASVTLAWNPCTNPIVAGFNAYWSTNGFQTNKVDAGIATSITLSNLPCVQPEVFEFTATTYSAAGAESAMSLPVFMTNYLYQLTNQTFQIWSGSNRLLNVANPTWTQMFFRLSNGWLTAASSLKAPAWNNISQFVGLTNKARLRGTNILQFSRTP